MTAKWMRCGGALLAAATLALAGCKGSAGSNGTNGVSTGSIAVTVYGADGAALSGATVTTIPASSTGTTAADGTATLSGVPIGSLLVTANKTGLKADGAGVSLVAGGTATATLHLSAGSEFALARIVGIPNGSTDLLPTGEVRLTTNSATQAASANQIKTLGVANVPVKQYVYMQAGTEDAAGNAITAQSWTIASDAGSSVKTLEYWDGTVDTTTTPPTRTWKTMPVTTPITPPTAADVRFRPDVPGLYTVTVSATAGTVTSTYHLRIYAGAYVGVSWCASCHSNAAVVGVGNDVYQEWALTGHATKFEKSYGMYSWSSDYCVGCHTTGYDESTLGGFDDKARESGWDPTAAPPASACTTTGGVTKCATVNSMLTWSKDKWPALANFIADPVTVPMQTLMNIQCESCHGPGSNHPDSASHMTWDPSVCAQCHTQPAQWSLSKHSNQPSPKEWGSASCMPCHSGQGFVVAKVKNQPIVFPDQSFPGYPATVFEKGLIQPIGCVTCHDPHLGTGQKSSQLRLESTSYTAPMGFTVTAGESAACKTCHVDKRDTTYYTQYLAGQQSRGPHMTQVDMLAGKGGSEFAGKTYASSYHTTSTDTPSASECTTCHMKVATYAPACSTTNPCPGTLTCGATSATCGCATNSDCSTLNPAQVCSHGTCTDQNYGGHTFNMSYTPSGSTTTYDHLAACTGCHPGLTTFDRPRTDWTNGGTSSVGIQTQIGASTDTVTTTLLGRLASKINKALGTSTVPSSGLNTMTPKPTATQLQAIWNFWYVANDGSGGVHNTKYAVELLCDSLKALDPADPCTRP